MKKTIIILIRHGQTDWNAQGRWQGHADIPLNEIGLAQAKALAERLKGWPVQRVYSSDLKRAAMTAETLADALGLTPVFDPVWRERDVGDFSGLTGDQTREKYPEVWAGVKRGAVNPPNGETQNELYDRATEALKRVLASHQGEMVLVISHGGMLAAAISHILGLPAHDYGRFSLGGNTGMSVVIQDQRGTYLSLLNDTSHLSPTPYSISQ